MIELFNVTVSDPPWLERGGGKIKRGADAHYPLMKTSDILEAMIRCPLNRPAPDSVHCMWTTMSSLADGIWLLGGLGFRYVTHTVWVKTKMDLAGLGLSIGIGQYARGCHELMLIGTRGSGFAVKTDARNLLSVIMAPPPREDGKRVHSRKPLAMTEWIESRFRGPYLEMFARKGDRPGWSYWGSEYSPEETDDDEHDTPGDDAAVPLPEDGAQEES